MVKTSNLVYTTLVVGVTVLFIGVGFQPAIAVVQKEVGRNSTPSYNDYNLLANLSLDIGEYISDNRIDYEETDYKPPGNQTINVKINFRCPENLKIVVRYSYYATIEDHYIASLYEFFDVKDTLTIINGSNPPDINESKTIFIASRLRELEVTLRIKTNLTAYEFIDGVWVKLHNDSIFNETIDWVKFWNSRSSERTKNPNDDCDLCPKVSNLHLVLIDRLVNRVETLKTELSVVSKLNPLIEEKYQELSKRITTFKEKNKELQFERPRIIRKILCGIAFLILSFFHNQGKELEGAMSIRT